jgi:undecaprenyl-diphosphatase
LLRVEKEVALRFSFLLFIPAVIGAAVLSVVDSDGLLFAAVDSVSLLVGLIVTAVVGYFSLRLLLRIVMKGRLYLFAFYCWAVGSVVLLVQFLGL